MSHSSEIECVAIVGMAGRFPGASSVNEFWAKVCAGQECISFFSDEELLSSGADPDQMRDAAYVRARGVLPNVDLFDHEFFGFTPREAQLTDPQHRIFLECAWEAMEDAGYEPATVQGSVGVFAGASLNTYLLRHVFANLGAAADFVRGFQADGYPVLIGNDKDYLASRVAYKLNLRGPAITIQTACSTSLVAIVQACQSLLGYQCDAALAGGVSITLPQQRGYIYQEGAIASADGHCRVFDARATGTVFGSGCGVVFLKRLSEALRDGDSIYAVIKGAAVNNDGAEKVSFSAPSVDGQAEVIALAHALAGVSADTIAYVEAHGTGTPLGDPIEVAALTQAFRATTDRKRFCALGSVKTNVGHLEAAAGVTGLIKASLAISQRRLPPSLHFETPNPNIDFENSPFYVVTRLSEWPETASPRRAGVSSFGMGGTNAHVVIEEAPLRPERREVSLPQLLPLSARTPASLVAACARLGQCLENGVQAESATEPAGLPDVACTLQVGRRSFKYRHAVVAEDIGDAIRWLDSFAQKAAIPPPCPEEPPTVAFLFPGQGGQRANMCRELYDSERSFRQTVDGCCDSLQAALGLDLRGILYPTPGRESQAEEQLNATALAQPAIFVIGFALAQLWKSWGIQPAALSGHSIGEFVAAVLADVMSLEDGLRLVAKRGRLMQEMPEGAMLAVRLAESEALHFLDDRLAIAVVNAPRSCVVSGPFDRIELLQQRLAASGIGCQLLRTSHAFHSSMMKPAADTFFDEVRQVVLKDAKLRIVSTRTGRWIEPSEWSHPEYWSRQLLEPVRFMDAAGTLLEGSSLILLEVGPGQTLTKLMRQHPARRPGHLVLSGVPLSEKTGDRCAMLGALGQLWCAGVTVDWHALHGETRYRRVSLPTYPFDRKRFWIDLKTGVGDPLPEVPRNMEGSTTGEPAGHVPAGTGIKAMSLEKVIHKQLQIMAEQLESIGRSRKRN
jgi:phthiocerol/phenolphthiocerol synthesis type-I polyketide synthase E